MIVYMILINKTGCRIVTCVES